MAGFDPDAYLASQPAFDPDAYLAGKPKESSTVGNIVGGLVRGAGSIGATLLTPIDAAARALNNGQPFNIGGFDIVGQDRRAGMDAALDTMGVDRDSLAFKGGKLTSEIAGTAGAGGVLARGAAAIPQVATRAPLLLNALRSGGLSLGGTTGNRLADLAIRSAGGAATGGAAAGLVNPEDAGTGVLIGGALPGAVQVAGATGRGIRNAVGSTVKNTLGVTTGAGSQAISTAYQAGKQGSDDFLNNMRGNVPMEDVLVKAKEGLAQMRQQRGDAYRSGMAAVYGDKSVIPFAPIEQAMSKLKSMGSYKGQVINKNAAGTVDELAGLVEQWKGLNPAEYHTPEGLDALKKAIGDVRDSLQYGSPARAAADSIYNAVKKEITTQAPTYSKVMKDYQEASQLVSEIERTLSLKPGASVDTAMRKLQSLMRNNVNTNYGNRLDLAGKLEQQGGQSIINDVAGQSLNSWTPRGLQAATSGGALLAAVPTGGASLALLPASSPRLAGELAYGLGAMNRGIGTASSSTTNRLAELLRRGNVPQLDRQSAAAILATTPVLAANQR